MLIRPLHLVTVDVIYHLPDHPSILNEFIWQVSDVVPELFKVQRFLHYWKHNIDAAIAHVLVDTGGKGEWRNAKDYIKYD